MIYGAFRRSASTITTDLHFKRLTAEMEVMRKMLLINMFSLLNRFKPYR